MTTLDGKIVLVTGAGGGFGREMIRQFLQAGSYLVLADQEQGTLHDVVTTVVATLGRVPGKILGYVAADLTTSEGSTDLHRQVQAITFHVDILVNNAGIAYSGPFTAIPQPSWEQLMQINLLAPLRLTALFLPDMLAQRRGHIANVSSSAGLVGTPGLAAYATAKWGLRGFGESLAGEVEPYGVRVTTIYPFFARTPILGSLQFGNGPRQVIPDWLLYDPQFVVAALLDGIRHNTRHVYPGAIPKLLDALQRFTPWALPLLGRSLRSEAPIAVPPPSKT